MIGVVNNVSSEKAYIYRDNRLGWRWHSVGMEIFASQVHCWFIVVIIVEFFSSSAITRARHCPLSRLCSIIQWTQEVLPFFQCTRPTCRRRKVSNIFGISLMSALRVDSNHSTVGAGLLSVCVAALLPICVLCLFVFFFLSVYMGTMYLQGDIEVRLRLSFSIVCILKLHVFPMLGGISERNTKQHWSAKYT